LIKNYDILIVGYGTAGLCTALQLADDFKIAIFGKENLPEATSLYAQGGIAAVQDLSIDSINSHIKDTMLSGAELCDKSSVKFVVKNAKSLVEWLINKGVKFTLNNNQNNLWPYHLNKEGGHSHRRIIHSGDTTGKSIQITLSNLITKHPNIDIYENCIAIDLILNKSKCIGLYIYNIEKNCVQIFIGFITVLATGGASQVYLYNSNPVISSGDGMGMAYRAGCRLANMEFNQFHPTCFYQSHKTPFLITEAMRGEGATLHLPSGERFMLKFDKRAELATRDIITRAIYQEMQRLNIKYVYLDISHKSKKFVIQRFPNIYYKCLQFGYDITKDPIPVIPAAHYTCGGIMVNQNSQTDIMGLYAIGETSYTGLHGANRMASNSLIECLVYAWSGSSSIRKYLLNKDSFCTLNDKYIEYKYKKNSQKISIKKKWNKIQNLMWNFVGIIRNNQYLEKAKKELFLLKEEIDQLYELCSLNKDIIEIRNLVLIADIITKSAILRNESRGLHYSRDYPKKGNKLYISVISKNNMHFARRFYI